MYDILQLNDMLVPELLDIADQLKIDNPKKLDKQELIYKILDRQAVSTTAAASAGDKTKRKRIIKASTANSTEEAIVEEAVAEEKKPAKKLVPKKEEKSKRPRKKSDDEVQQEELPLQTEDAITEAQANVEENGEATEMQQPAERTLQISGAAA